MKKVVLFILIIILVSSPCGARDFMVEFVEENYKEAVKAYSNVPLIYHSIQVNSQAGSKLLILVGDNLEYRKWLRYYIAVSKKLITTVPDNENDKFISSKAYEIDVINVHPVNGNKWLSDIPISGDVGVLEGNEHVLIIDTNGKRNQLIASVVNNMGFTAMVFENGGQALNIFRLQPEKFKLVIVNHQIPGMKTEVFVDGIIKLDHKIPILVETGYKNQKIRNKFIAKFSETDSVVLKSVVLEDLQNTIKKLVKEKA
ncbi:MAG: response regulator [Desulfobacteraceae bacterium]|nr:response regulator [Desulfobacteraceae bacterium]